MKKSLNELLDQAAPEELEPFADALGAPDLPPETLSSVKENVYAKTGLKPSRKSRKRTWYRTGALAACLALVAGAIVLAPMLRKVPVWEDAHYTAAEVALLFDAVKYDGEGATNAYTKVYAPDTQYLYLDPLPEDDYLGVYRYNGAPKALDKEEFKTFVDGILPKLAPAVNANIPSYEIEKWDYSFEESLVVRGKIGIYDMTFEQTETEYWFHLLNLSMYGDRKITLAGEPVQIDQRLSDNEIINSLQPLKTVLFDLFGVSFSDVKIVRSFDSYSKHGAGMVEIYFYNEELHARNPGWKHLFSDYICIRFDNTENYAGDIVSDDILTVAGIGYRKNRDDAANALSPIANAKKLSLEDAEALLYHGYVFGGHSCPLCMAAQDKVDFEGYDFVGLEYVFGYTPQTNQPTVGLPFYAFYKNIGTAENGNAIYAKTYVPAIEVKGLKEYFQSQTENHRTGNTGIYE